MSLYVVTYPSNRPGISHINVFEGPADFSIHTAEDVFKKTEKTIRKILKYTDRGISSDSNIWKKMSWRGACSREEAFVNFLIDHCGLTMLNHINAQMRDTPAATIDLHVEEVTYDTIVMPPVR